VASLARVVSRGEVVALSLNDVIGSGVYLLPAVAAASFGGGGSVLAVPIAAVGVLLVVLCFAEAGSRFDEPGGAYVYTRAAFGDFVGFEVGWMTWLARVASVAALAAGFAQALGFLWPAAAGSAAEPVACALLAGLAGFHVLGVKLGARSAVLLAILKVVPLLLLIAVALPAIQGERLLDARVAEGGLRVGVLELLWAYAGFENTAAPAGEFKRPRRDVPFALVTQLAVATLLYTTVQLVAVGTVPDLPHAETPLADGAALLFGAGGGVLLTVGAVVSIFGTTSNTMLTGPRYLYALAAQRRLPGVFARVHARFQTPWVAIVVMALVALPLVLTGTFVELARLSVVARLATYIGTAAAVPVLRRKLPASEDALRLPGGPAIPIAAIAVCLVFLLAATPANLVAAAVALAVGAGIYAVGR
jgi:amino acid transporter